MVKEFKALRSSNILGIAYDKDTHQLTVDFTSGAKYEYDEVPLEVYEDFMHAGSPGEFFADNVKNVYAYRRVG